MKPFYKSLAVAGLLVAVSATSALADKNRSANDPFNPNASRVVKESFINHNGYNSALNLRNKESAVTTPYNPRYSSIMTRSDVKQLQNALNDHGYNIRADGVWGSETSAALRSFQRTRRLEVTGNLDIPTRDALQLNTVYLKDGTTRHSNYTTSR